MKHTVWMTVAVATVALTGVDGRTQTAAPTYSLTCENTGAAPQEPLGDREGHAMSASTYTCRVVGGPMDGGVVTGTQNWEWQGPSGTGLGGAGVVRHTKGAMAYTHNADSKNNLKIENGKVVGFAGSGAGRNMLVAGAASPYANKAFRYTFRSTGFNQFVVDVVMGE